MKTDVRGRIMPVSACTIRLCQLCRHRGGACAPGVHLAQKLAEAMARLPFADGLELSGTLEVADCAQPCRLAWHISAAGSWVFGDVGAEADIAAMVAQAEECEAGGDPGGLLQAAAAVIVTRPGALH